MTKTADIELATPEQCLSFGARVATKVGKMGVPFDVLQSVLNDGNDHPVYAAIEGALLPKACEATEYPHVEGVVMDQIIDWRKFYVVRLGFDVDMAGVRIPARVKGFDRLIVVPQGISVNQVYEKGKVCFPSWKWCDDDLESVMRELERGGAKETYAIWVRDGREADKDLRKMSAEDIAERKIDTESLLERLLHGFKYWSETGKHLDERSYTLCASSRFADGFVPRVLRSSFGRVCVYWFDVRRADPSLGARRAVR
ncbi:MAG TPA: hypothetical protein VFQ72_01570 [Candidatus Paceibacterota bacterium]|nr:hypothetical protein [Candidatus Paceibacterota bacterium]